MPIPKTLNDILALPTAPFLETAVLSYIAKACGKLAGVKARFDHHGNLLAHYRFAPRARTPLAFVAHTDHPGFIALDMLDARTVRAAFRGGVKSEYFSGARVRFWSAGRWVRGRVSEISRATRIADVPGWSSRPEEVPLRVAAPVAPQSLGMWDLPDPVLGGDLVQATACDDLAGSAAMLTLLQRLSRKRSQAEVYCLFTRAEEVGFAGAIAAARTHTVPRQVPIISVETSSTLPHAPIGDGPIVRVGDRSSVFSPSLIAFCERVAKSFARRRKGFIYQRKLMDGGSCEATPFVAYGYVAAGVCIALGNYHNMDGQRAKIASEYISLHDWNCMVDLFEALVLDEGDRDQEVRSLRERMDQRYAEYEALLHK